MCVHGPRLQGGGECDDDGAENQRWPPWLKPLLSTSFFVQCRIHADAHKSECNMYCLDCMNGALCSLCLAHHRDHHSIQVSRATSLALMLMQYWRLRSPKCLLPAHSLPSLFHRSISLGVRVLVFFLLGNRLTHGHALPVTDGLVRAIRYGGRRTTT
jgi:hypothetical protein